MVRLSRRLHRPWVTPPANAEQFRDYLRRSRQKNRASFLVRTLDGNELAGAINVSEIVRGPLQSAFLGYYGSAPLGGRGLMTEGMKLVLRHAFTVLRLHRLEANIQPGNAESIALVKRLGFRLEGLSPRYLKIGGRWRDHERWAMLAEQWPGVGRSRRPEVADRDSIR